MYLRSHSSYGESVDSVTVGMDFSEVNTLIFIAEKQNYFTANAINLTIKQYSSSATALDGLINGEVDVATSNEFNVVQQVLTNSEVKVFGTIDKVQQVYIIAHKGKGIENIQDFANKTIGVTLGSTSEFFLSRFLELNHVNMSQVTVVDAQPAEMGNLLKNGRVEAVVTWQPFVENIENLMVNETVRWSVQAGQPIYNVAVCTSDWATDQSEVANKFLRAIAQAEEYVINEAVNAKNAIREQLKYTETYVESIWPNHQFTLSLDQSLVLAMYDEAHWLIVSNRTQAQIAPNFTDCIYADSLETVKPESVNIIG